MRSPREIVTALYNRATLRADRGPIGVGLVGVGGWGASNAASIMQSRRFTIVGVHDVEAVVADRFARRYKVKVFRDLDALLGDPAVDAVVITVPNHLHGTMVRASAAAGKAVFIEKPLASNPDECRALGEYCGAQGVVLQVGHQMRREPVFRAMKRALDDGGLGTPIYAHGVYTLARQQRNDWRNDAVQCPGGSMEQLGIHLIDVLVALFGAPARSEGWARNIPTSGPGPDWGQVSVTFENGVHASVSSSFSSPRHLMLTVFCENGSLATDGVYLYVRRAGGPVRREKPPGPPGGVAQFTDFADAIEGGAPPDTGAIEAIAVMNVIQSMHGQ